MNSLANMATVMTRPVLLSLFTITAVFGCAVGPAAMSSRSFTVTGFTLPVPMVYSMGVGVAAQAAGISTSENGARAFVMRTVMQAVFDVLEQHGRAAGLPDPIIQVILSQLTVNITYQPLRCDTVSVNPMPNDPRENNWVETEAEEGELVWKKYMSHQDSTRVKIVHTQSFFYKRVPRMAMMNTCIIIGRSVTAICTGAGNCMTGNGMDVLPIPDVHLSISGTLTTTNVIMANWSREMWQIVVNRVVRTLASGPFGQNFFSALATVS